MEKKINLRCGRCGNAIRSDRQKWEPPEAVEAVTSECLACDGERYSGKDPETFLYDRAGNEVRPSH